MTQLSKLLHEFEIDMGIICEKKRCTVQASRIVVLHFLDHCDELPPTGDKVYLMCYRCARIMLREIVGKYVRMKYDVGQLDSEVECMTCGRPMPTFEDLLRTEDLVCDFGR